MQGILVVSFGTSFDETREKNIGAIEQSIKDKGYKVYRAFTSNMIRKSLAKRDILIDDTTSALEKMYSDGITDVLVLSTHLLFGDEYNKMQAQISEKSDKFTSIKVAKPLLANEIDCKRVIDSIYAETAKDADEALILMGHGTEHFYNVIYSAMNFLAQEQGHEDMYITTVEGYPTFDDAVNWAVKKGFKKAILAPLMLVAGDHAVNDMASSEEDSLRTLIEQKDVKIRTNIKGLGEYFDIKQLYIEHLEEIM